MRNIVIVFALLILAVGCKKKNDDSANNALAMANAQSGFQAAFPGIDTSQGGFFPMVAGAFPVNYIGNISSTGKMMFGSSYLLSHSGDSFQLVITGSKQQDTSPFSTGAWHYNLNIWKWSSPNSIVGTGTLGLTNYNGGRKYYLLSIYSRIAQYGEYMDSL